MIQLTILAVVVGSKFQIPKIRFLSMKLQANFYQVSHLKLPEHKAQLVKHFSFYIVNHFKCSFTSFILSACHTKHLNLN